MRKLIINTAAQNIERLHHFYDQVGYQSIDEHGSFRYDGQALIHLDGTNEARTSIHMYADKLETIVAKIINLGYNVIQQSESIGFSDPNGVKWKLYEFDEYPDIHFNRDFEMSLLGKYFGLGIESFEYERSIEFYKALGYKIISGDPANKSYLSLAQEGCHDLTLFYPGSCPHAFYNPSLTFFNGKKGNPVLIDKMRSVNIQFTEEVTVFSDDGAVDNVIVEDGGGLHFFVFND